jgi:hypothetical protein
MRREYFTYVYQNLNSTEIYKLLVVEILPSILSRVLLLVKYMLHILQFATGWTLRGLNPSEEEIVRTRQIGPDSYPASYPMGPKLLSEG